MQSQSKGYHEHTGNLAGFYEQFSLICWTGNFEHPTEDPLDYLQSLSSQSKDIYLGTVDMCTYNEHQTCAKGCKLLACHI